MAYLQRSAGCTGPVHTTRGWREGGVEGGDVSGHALKDHSWVAPRHSKAAVTATRHVVRGVPARFLSFEG